MRPARSPARWPPDASTRPRSTSERSQAHLDEPDLPDVDLFIRTSGEQRTSNFLLWQSAYAELVFVDTPWPDFDRRALWSACLDYARRDRRFGAAGPVEAPNMISLLQFDVTDEVEFTDRMTTALRVLAARPGYLSGSAGRSTDDPTRWVLITEWANVGSYRRALGAYEVKLYATPLLAQAIDVADRVRAAAQRGAGRRADERRERPGLIQTLDKLGQTFPSSNPMESSCRPTASTRAATMRSSV